MNEAETRAEPDDNAGVTIYQSDNGTVEVRLDRDTVWLSQDQMATLFGVQKAAVSKHLKNIYACGELERGATVSKLESVRQEGERKVSRQIEHFNLDAAISVGYRVNSARATRFRQWATRLLREHLTQGYTLNRQRLEANARELEAALELVRKAARSPDLAIDTGRGLIDIVSRYAQTFALLQRYDEGLLTEPPEVPGGVLPTLAEARTALATLKHELMARGEATDLFARDRGDGLEALLGNLDQSVFGQPAYPALKPRQRTCCTSSSRTTPLPMATSAAGRSCLSISCTATAD